MRVSGNIWYTNCINMMLEQLIDGSRSCRAACINISVPCRLGSPATLRNLPTRRLAIRTHRPLRVSAIAAGVEASTVKIIVQGRNVELSDSLRSYVVKLHTHHNLN